MRDYAIEEFPIILLEHIEEVCYRMRRQNKLAQTVHFSIGYSKITLVASEKLTL